MSTGDIRRRQAWGSFYFNFKNKQDLGLQVLEFFDQSFDPMIMEIRDNASVSPLARMAPVFDALNIENAAKFIVSSWHGEFAFRTSGRLPPEHINFVSDPDP